MRIQTERKSLKNHWMISIRYDFPGHQQHCPGWCCGSHSVLLWFEVVCDMQPALPDVLSLLPSMSTACLGAPCLISSTPILVSGAARCCKVHLKATILVQSTLRLGHHWILVQQLPEAPRDTTVFSWRNCYPNCSSISPINTLLLSIFQQYRYQQ